MHERLARPARLVAALIVLTASHGAAQATNTLSPDLAARLDSATKAIVNKTHVPSASVGIVQNGRVVYLAAFGMARLSPPLPATPEMRYAIGSISKQFTTACILLLLQEEGKLSSMIRLRKYFPRADARQGREDPQPPTLTPPATKITRRRTTPFPPGSSRRRPRPIVHEWATKPLDFDPGTQYQYSNTNFNIAGLIVEKASWRAVLGLSVATRAEAARHDEHHRSRHRARPARADRLFAERAGPAAPCHMEAPGWYFADGEMAMPVSDLLQWDISLMNQTLLAPASYAAMETEMRLHNGQGPATDLASASRCATGIEWCHMAAKSVDSWRRIPSSRTTRSPLSC